MMNDDDDDDGSAASMSVSSFSNCHPGCFAASLSASKRIYVCLNGWTSCVE